VGGFGAEVEVEKRLGGENPVFRRTGAITGPYQVSTCSSEGEEKRISEMSD